jgi:hypothetical protein
VVAATIAAVTLWPSNGGKHGATGSKHPHHTAPVAAVTTLRPEAATGFDPLTSAKNDPGNENSAYAQYAIDGSAQTAWTTQWYQSPEFGGLKTGSGLLLEMPGADTYRSVTVNFGSIPGADVSILVGSSPARSAANLASMTKVAGGNDVSGQVTFRITKSVTGRYLIIWFTKLPPKPGSGHWYMGQVDNVVVRGLS